jgi:class 3 adenylate cyclase
MPDAPSPPPVHYAPPRPLDLPPSDLVLGGGAPGERRFRFYDRIQIGRYKPRQEIQPAVLLIEDPTVSTHHCSLTRAGDGRFRLRDSSRNGTRVDGRRLVPNMEFEVRVGQTIRIADVLDLRLDSEGSAATDAGIEPGATVGTSTLRAVTVLVGDIRDYTVLVQKADPPTLQRCVGRLFASLERTVLEHGGTVKEYQGDSIFAFWEEHRDRERNQAELGCEAALALHRAVQRIAADREAWSIQDFPLRMDWALATGPVVIDSLGGEQRTGLSLVGGPVVLAFRMEKFASDRTGPILACPVTREKAGRAFQFKRLGRRHAKGFDQAMEVFALRGPR